MEDDINVGEGSIEVELLLFGWKSRDLWGCLHFGNVQTDSVHSGALDW